MFQFFWFDVTKSYIIHLHYFWWHFNVVQCWGENNWIKLQIYHAGYYFNTSLKFPECASYFWIPLLAVTERRGLAVYLGKVPCMNSEQSPPKGCYGMPLMCTPQDLCDRSTQWGPITWHWEGIYTCRHLCIWQMPPSVHPSCMLDQFMHLWELHPRDPWGHTHHAVPV